MAMVKVTVRPRKLPRLLEFFLGMWLFGCGTFILGVIEWMTSLHHWPLWPNVIYFLLCLIGAATGAIMLTHLVWGRRR